MLAPIASRVGTIGGSPLPAIIVPMAAVQEKIKAILFLDKNNSFAEFIKLNELSPLIPSPPYASIYKSLI